MKTNLQKLQLLGLVTALTIISISTYKPAQAKGLPVGETKFCKLSVCSTQTKTEKSSLPKLVAASVLLDASRQSGLPLSALKITNTWQTSKSPGCTDNNLEFDCLQVMRFGWLVTVKVGNQRWVYDTNENGSFVQLVKQRNFPRFQYRPYPIKDIGFNDSIYLDDPYLRWSSINKPTMPYFPGVIDDVNYHFTGGDIFTEIGHFDKDENFDSLPNLQNTKDLPEIEAAKTADVPEPLSVLGVLTFGAFSFGLRQKRKSKSSNDLGSLNEVFRS